MTKKEVLIIASHPDAASLSLHELEAMFALYPDFIQSLIDHDIISPVRSSQGEWLFEVHHLQRIKRALRLHRDLEVNLPGIAIVLDLLDEIESLEADKAILIRHFSRL